MSLLKGILLYLGNFNYRSVYFLLSSKASYINLISSTLLPIKVTLGVIGKVPLRFFSKNESLELMVSNEIRFEEAVKEYTPLNIELTLCSPSLSSHIAILTALVATRAASEEDPTILN